MGGFCPLINVQCVIEECEWWVNCECIIRQLAYIGEKLAEICRS